MTPAPTLDPQRTEQLRTFLVVEAAASAAAPPRPLLGSARRRALAGAAAVLVLGGGLVAAQAVGGPAPRAIAVEVDDGWTTIRLVDVDADPDAVVAQLRDAGFRAERVRFEVERGDGYTRVVREPDGTNAGATGALVAGIDGGGGERGLVGLSVTLPDGVLAEPEPPAAETPEPPTVASAPAEAGTGAAEVVPHTADAPTEADLDTALAAHGVRFEDDGALSLRRDADVTVVVATER